MTINERVSPKRLAEIIARAEVCDDSVLTDYRDIESIARELQQYRAADPVIPDGLHPATADLVLRFATALAEKLHKAEQKYGYSDNWQRNDWYDDCLQSLWEHIEKGDPRDVAAYCAFMWFHGWATTDYDRGVQKAVGPIAAPQVTSAPEQVPESLKDRLLTICDLVEDNDEYCQDIWSVCRAAMLGDVTLISEGETAAPAVQAEQPGITEQVSQPYTLPECFERLFKHAQGLTFGDDWNRGTAAKYHRDLLIKAVDDCHAAIASGNSPAIPDGWIPVSERMPGSRHAVLVGRWFGSEWASKWATYVPGHPDAQDSGWLIPGASWTPTHWHELPAAPKQYFREIPNSSTNNCRENADSSTKCWCHTCRPVTMTDMRFVVCPECGNKRCPHANDHRNACTGSNEPGQEGSAYPAAPKQEAE
ncbi:DUF551 domain-containing protein [Atlantibacter hermannii]|uniref:DUF551 domain-containing protein n=1 Tax=Atlantibacter hermannii TaxID=565 RepID=UPI0028009FDF|nr:DUF551 domain-containing protein [Atlantibacter hermannii]MDQ7883668.1 DUF551 domain-containing protein [Atlantibacter hermannii]